MANLDFITENKITLEADEELKQQNSKMLKLTVAVIVLGAISSFIVSFFNSSLSTLILFLAGFIIILSYILYSSFRGKSDAKYSGAAGEDLALEVLSELPDSFHLFNQVDIPNMKSRTGFNEADLIALTKDTIFVIEVKHNNGSVFARRAK